MTSQSTSSPETNTSSASSQVSGATTAGPSSFNTSLSTSSNSSNHDNVTNPALPATGGGESPGLPGGVIALLLGLLLLGVGIFCLVVYLKRTGRLYKMVPFRPIGRYRRSSTSSSRGPLDEDDDRSTATVEADRHHDHDDSLPRTRDGNMFTIDDYDTEQVDLDSQSRGTNDEYYYDEVFGKSVFEDEATNASMRQLYLAGEQDEDDMFDVDAIVSSITGTKAKSTKT